MRPENEWFTPDELASTRNRLVVALLVLFGLPMVGVAALASPLVAGIVAVAAVAVAGVLWWYNRAFERAAALRFSDDAVEYRRGVWFRQHSEVPYRRVTNVTTSQGPIQRSLDAGSLQVQTAGQSGQAGAELAVSGLTDYEALKERLMSKVRAADGDDATGSPDRRRRPASEQPTDDELLAEVRRIRELLE